MNTINFLGNHLLKYLPADISLHRGISTICAFTGEYIDEGFLLKDILSANFTEYEYIKYNSDYISINAFLCLAEIIPSANNINRKNSLRVYNYYVDDKELLLLKREELLDYIIKFKQTPFVFCITYNNKKHTSFKAKLNYDNEEFVVRTDLSNVHIKKKEVLEVLPIMQNWYTILQGKEDTAAQPTFFSKQEILSGKLNFNKVLEYGEEKAFEENEILAQYRGAQWFELITHCLNKKKEELT